MQTGMHAGNKEVLTTVSLREKTFAPDLTAVQATKRRLPHRAFPLCYTVKTLLDQMKTQATTVTLNN